MSPMKNFITLEDLVYPIKTIALAKSCKQDPFAHAHLGQRKTIGLLFFNPSLRTRLSTQKAARNLGLDVMVMNFSNEAWAIEYENETIMSGIRSEHVKEAVQVVSQYCDFVAIRAFASLTDKKRDEEEQVLRKFAEFATIPIINMESATAHPLQALADGLTIHEQVVVKKPKIVLSWAPHPKALPHAVANSFIGLMNHTEADFVITHPEGYDLNPAIVGNHTVNYNQEEALAGADVVYVKNWCSYTDYGAILRTDNKWMMTREKMERTNDAFFMHCLPIRRNVVASDGVLDHPKSLVIEQANNRTFAAQAVLQEFLTHG
jgi:N-succinyl-L-ornithine transcarbamylase